MCVLIAIPLAGLAQAETGDVSDFLISQDNGVSEQNYPSIAVGLGGKFSVIWSDMRNGNGDVYCRLYDSGAIAVSDEFMLNDDNAAAWQLEPALSSDWYGNYYAVWKDYRNNSYPFGPDVYFQKLDSIGKTGVNKNITVELPDSSHQSPAIGSTGWGNCVVAWADLRNHNWDIYSQLLETDGDPIGTNQRVNTDVSTTAQHEPDIALSADGWYVVTWYDRRSGNDDVFIQKFDSSGAPVGINRLVNGDGGITPQKFPSVAIGGNGTIIVVWTDWRQGSYPANPDIYSQRFDASLNKIGDNVLVNRDGAGTAQRDPRVSADRMGNACIVWSDSTSLGWNVKAQMIDNYGNFRDANFTVNTHEQNDQLLGDVALDGYSLYFTWVDNRNGNFDIYGRLIQYNDPTLFATPDRIDVSIDRNDPTPDPVSVAIQNAGYGELDYRLSADQSWIGLSGNSGSTPDSIVVTINPAGLGYGAHIGQISLIDMTHGDSSAFIPVTLVITGPMVSFSVDSLAFEALIELGDPGTQTIRIDNSGSGTLDWELTATEDWITLDPTEGSDGDEVAIGCDLSALTAGSYSGYLIATDTGAVNSPESLLVTLDVYSDIPYLVADPPSLDLMLTQGESLDDSIQIFNYGGGVSAWSALNSQSWLTLNAAAGSDDEFLPYSIESSALTPGYYSDSIVISDDNAFNTPIAVPVSLAITSFDTIIAAPAMADAGSQFQMQLYLHAINSIEGGLLNLGYEQSYFTVDSVLLPVGDLLDRITLTNLPDSGRFSIAISTAAPDSEIAPGTYHLCDMYATANDTIGGTTKLFSWGGGEGFYLEGLSGSPYPPYLDAGDIEISSPTSTDDWGREQIPAVFSLGQNYPNPFNGTTIIEYSVARTDNVKLEIFNILGQIVKQLVDINRSAGQYRVTWDGRDEYGGEVASGLYLYRLTTSESAAVKKLILLK